MDHPNEELIRYDLPELLARIGGRSFEHLNTFQTHRFDDARQFFDALAKPCEFVGVDPIVLRVSGLHIGVFQLLEARPVGAPLSRPCVDQARVDPFGLRPQERQIMNVRRLCRALDYAEWCRDVLAFP